LKNGNTLPFANCKISPLDSPKIQFFHFGTALAEGQGMNGRISERIALVFAIGAGLLTAIDGAILVLSIPVGLYLGLISLAKVLSFSVDTFIGLGFFAMTIARLGLYAFTVNLFRGYVRHASGGLDRKAVDRLWIKTIVWNAIFFFASAYLNLQVLFAGESYLDCRVYAGCGWLLQTLNECSPVFIVLTIWWGFATFAPFLAMASVEDSEQALP